MAGTWRSRVKDYKGVARVRRRTSRKRFRAALARVSEWIKAQRSMPVRQLIEALNARLRGHYNFYGVIGNYGSLCSFLNQTRRVLRKWLGRRSQKGRLGWERFTALEKLFPLERPRTYESRHRQMVLGGSC